MAITKPKPSNIGDDFLNFIRPLEEGDAFYYMGALYVATKKGITKIVGKRMSKKQMEMSKRFFSSLLSRT